MLGWIMSYFRISSLSLESGFESQLPLWPISVGMIPSNIQHLNLSFRHSIAALLYDVSIREHMTCLKSLELHETILHDRDDSVPIPFSNTPRTVQYLDLSGRLQISNTDIDIPPSLSVLSLRLYVPYSRRRADLCFDYGSLFSHLPLRGLHLYGHLDERQILTLSLLPSSITSLSFHLENLEIKIPDGLTNHSRMLAANMDYASTQGGSKLGNVRSGDSEDSSGDSNNSIYLDDQRRTV